MSEPLLRLPVGVVIERRKAATAWIDHVWQPVAVLSGAPAAEPWTVLASEPDCLRIYAGPAEVALHAGDAANYRDNLDSGVPALWVVLRPTGGTPPFTIVTVTADPSEGEAMTSAGDDLVEAVAMPASIAEHLAAFVAGHHVERTAFKRQRDRADPEALARRGRPVRDDEE